ncbi:metal ABC transporter solute-binding protein, Zn/Mn family [Paracoccus aerius]
MKLPLVATLAALLALPAQAEQLKVATTFTIIADMARNVAGEAATVESITKPGAEIHNYQPTSGDLIRAADADLILVNGLNLESWFQQFIDQLGDVPVAVVSDGIQPMSITGGDYDGKPNPHAWMALDSALVYVDNIATAMATADPDNAATYLANADAYKAQITQTIAPLRDAARALPPTVVGWSHPKGVLLSRP